MVISKKQNGFVINCIIRLQFVYKFYIQQTQRVIESLQRQYAPTRFRIQQKSE